MNRHQRRPGLLKRALACAAVLELLAGSVPSAQAQRRRGEPEANPQFQQQISGAAGGGGAPIDGIPTTETPTVHEAESASPRSVQGVQIGTSGAARPAPEKPTSPLETRVTVRVKGAPLETFLDTIQAQAHVNFIVTEGLESKRVTAFLQNVSVREALQVLLEIKGLTYQQIGKSNTYVVAPRSKAVENVITRIYTLNYVPLIPLNSADAETASLPVLGGSGGSGGSGGGDTAPAAPGGGAEKGGKGGGDDSVAIVTVLQSVLSKNGHVALEPRTNSLVVTDIPEVFPQVEQIIAELDRKAPQVMIEAQIVEIDSSRSRDIGLEWGGPTGQLAQFTGGMRDTSFPMNLTSDLSKTRFFDPFVPGYSSYVSIIGQQGTNQENDGQITQNFIVSNIRSSFLDLTSLQITLRALVARSEARFLGKPKILTLNNKPALMAIASSQAVGRSLQTSGGGSGVTNQTAAAERVTTGLILKVTPQVNKEGYITMLIQPSYTDAQISGISTQANPVWDPVSRAASTLVRVRNGQTLVIGGLLQSTESKTVRKVPLLGYIPLLGWFFTSSDTLRKNTDLVIFLTPTIVSD
jgi:type II secretory pathway component GspD/PulD (secretin)